MKGFLTILKKELKRIFTDKRMLMAIVLPALLTFVLYNILGVVVKSAENSDEPYVIHVLNEPDDPMFKDNIYNIYKETEGGLELTIIDDGQKEETVEAIKDQDVDLLIEYEVGFLDKLLKYQKGEEYKAPYVNIYNNSISIKSEKAASIYQIYINKLEEVIINEDLIATLPSDLATEESIALNFISQMIPMMLICLLVSCAASFCTESIAGEKERGTMATMLVTPVRRESIVFGKLGALTITTLISSFLSFLALITSIPNMMPLDIKAFNFYGPAEIFLILAVIIVTSILFTVLILIASTIAKTTKEANSFTTPIIMVAMAISMSALFMEKDVTPVLSLIPVLNSVISFKGLLSLDYSMLGIGFTLISNILVTLGAVLLLKHLFNSEKIMFSE